MTDAHEFNCPYCDLNTEYDWPLLIAFIAVVNHFHWKHGWKSFRVGCPLFDDQPPEPEEFNK